MKQHFTFFISLVLSSLTALSAQNGFVLVTDSIEQNGDLGYSKLYDLAHNIVEEKTEKAIKKYNPEGIIPIASQKIYKQCKHEKIGNFNLITKVFDNGNGSSKLTVFCKKENGFISESNADEWIVFNSILNVIDETIKEKILDNQIKEEKKELKELKKLEKTGNKEIDNLQEDIEKLEISISKIDNANEQINQDILVTKGNLEKQKNEIAEINKSIIDFDQKGKENKIKELNKEKKQLQKGIIKNNKSILEKEKFIKTQKTLIDSNTARAERMKKLAQNLTTMAETRKQGKKTMKAAEKLEKENINIQSKIKKTEFEIADINNSNNNSNQRISVIENETRSIETAIQNFDVKGKLSKIKGLTKNKEKLAKNLDDFGKKIIENSNAKEKNKQGIISLEKQIAEKKSALEQTKGAMQNQEQKLQELKKEKK